MYKDKTREIILDYYKNYGLKAVIEFAQNLLQLPNFKSDMQFRNEVHGETCEAILECCVIDFIKANKLEKKWFYTKGLVLKNVNNPDRFLTEVDFILFTPYQVIPIECRSYAGAKIITNRCTINRKDKQPYDVYAQHKLHSDILIDNISSFRLKTMDSFHVNPFQLAMFDFSRGGLRDTRDILAKREMPILNVNNIHKFLNTFIDKPETWHLQSLKRFVKIVNTHKERNTKLHLDYVKSLHGGNK